MDINKYNEDIDAHQQRWLAKPVLRKIYHDFHERIAEGLTHQVNGAVVELGSGIGNIKEVIPDCIRTDIFSRPWLDRTENAYALNFPADSLSNIILFDVFHHLEYPGTAMCEFFRVLVPGGRLLIFDPCLSLFGLLVYGVFHHEAVALTRPMLWTAPPGWKPEDQHYFAAASHATRLFLMSKYRPLLAQWRIHCIHRWTALDYVLSGGYSKPQLYPASFLPLLRWISKCMDVFPVLFATRMLVVLEKPPAAAAQIQNRERNAMRMPSRSQKTEFRILAPS